MASPRAITPCDEVLLNYFDGWLAAECAKLSAPEGDVTPHDRAREYEKLICRTQADTSFGVLIQLALWRYFNGHQDTASEQGETAYVRDFHAEIIEAVDMAERAERDREEDA